MTNWRNIVIWLVLGLSLVVVYDLFSRWGESTSATIPYSQFVTQAKQGGIAEVKIKGSIIAGQLSNGQTFDTFAPPNVDIAQELIERGVEVTAVPDDSNSPSLLGILLSWFPMLLLIGVWIFFMRQMQSGAGKALGFGKSRARLQGERNPVTFNDVAGIEETKQELEEIVLFLKDSKKYHKLGGKIPKGVLLVGPPGTGKTLIARALAGEAEVPFFSISGSDFVEMFVGVGASRVRDMFEQGKKHSPCIVFIDEIDAVGRHRGAGLGGGNDEREQTLNQLLVEMDGFETNQGVILVAATNRPDVLDPALLRPGRFDRQVVVPYPDMRGREKILEVHTRQIPLAGDVSLKAIAAGTPGFAGADLANLVNEAALLAARRGRSKVSQAECEDAKDKVLMGSERRSMVMSDDEKRLTAYHEAGHALVTVHSPEGDPVHKATIVPRGRALGMVQRLPERDRLSHSKSKLESDLAVAMGGRIAEEVIFGERMVTNGAASDIKLATELARRMVTEWGMSQRLGPLLYGEATQEVFLGHSVTQHKNIADATAQVVDEEVRGLVEQARQQAHGIITGNLEQLHAIAQGLLEHETLSRQEIEQLMRGEEIVHEPEPEASEAPIEPKTSVPPTRPSHAKHPAGLEPEPQGI